MHTSRHFNAILLFIVQNDRLGYEVCNKSKISTPGLLGTVQPGYEVGSEASFSGPWTISLYADSTVYASRHFNAILLFIIQNDRLGYEVCIKSKISTSGLLGTVQQGYEVGSEASFLGPVDYADSTVYTSRHFKAILLFIVQNDRLGYEVCIKSKISTSGVLGTVQQGYEVGFEASFPAPVD